MDSNPRGSGGEAPQGRWGDRTLSEVEGDARGASAPMEICEANLGSRPKAGIPPAMWGFDGDIIVIVGRFTEEWGGFSKLIVVR